MKRWCPLVLVLFASPANAQLFKSKLQKGFDALAVYDYFQARTLFQDQTKRHPSAAWYGLSVITGRADNPFYQLDSSYTFIQKADAAFTAAPDKERLLVKRFGVEQDAITAQRDRVAELSWEQTTKVNTIDGYERYMGLFAYSARAAEAKLVRDHLAFQDAREANSSEAYTAFIGRYPDARQVHEARTRLQEAVFRENTVDGSVASYEQFIAEHPGSPYVKNAEDEIFRLSTPHGTADEFMAFIKRYPMNTRVPDAWRSIYALSTRDLSAASITAFLKAYPDYPFIEELAQDFTTASMRLLPFRRAADSLWGYMDDQGVERIKAVYPWAEPFVKDQAIVERDGKVGTVNKQGVVVVPLEFDDVVDAGAAGFVVERDDMAGLLDRKGRIVLQLIYDEIGVFVDGIAPVSKDGRYGFINAAGAVVLPLAFDHASAFAGGLAVVEVDGHQGAINAKGDTVVPCQYDWVEGFAEGVSRVRLNGRAGIVGAFGEVLLPVEHDHVGAFKNGRAMVVDGNRCGYVDRKGQFVVPQQFEAQDGASTWGDFRNDHAVVRSKGKAGMIDLSGKLVLPCEFNDVGAWSPWLVPVKKKDKWGFANQKGKVAVEPKYLSASEMTEGVSIAQTPDGFILLDSTAARIGGQSYAGITRERDNHFVATSDAGTGLVNARGEQVLPFTFGSVSLVDGELAKVERNGRMAYLRLSDGKAIWKEEGFDAR